MLLPFHACYLKLSYIRGVYLVPIKLDFTGVSTNGFTPFPEKEPQKFTIFNISQEKGKESGAPYLKFEFKQSGGNRKAWRNFSLQPGALWALKKLLVDLDYDEDELETDFEFETADVLGREVLLVFGPERQIPGSDRMSQEVESVTAAE